MSTERVTVNPGHWGVVFCAALLVGCANMASFQTAEVLERGDREVGAGASFSSYNDQVLGGDDEIMMVPALNGWFRQGMGDGFEARGMAWLPLGWRAGIKYQIAGESGADGTHLAVGGDVGHMRVTTGTGDDQESLQLVDAYFPLYTGHRFGPRSAAYLTPQYVLRVAIGEDDIDIHQTVAATLGLGLGDRDRFYVEMTGGFETSSQSMLVHGGFGFSTGRW